MVEVKGFPGPLYPPDAAPGHQPSRDSPFVLACKRTAARCGAWPWNPDGWDDSYSNRFAHGDPQQKGTHAGIAGLQRWSGTLDDTGYVGERTLSFLRSVLVPQGRTHAGEHAMDSVAVQQVNQAWDAANPQPKGTSIRELALELATGELGVKESPVGSNMQKYGDWYGENGVPWCAIFATWAYLQAGNSDTFQTVRDAGQNDRYDYVPYIVSDARQGRYGLSVTSTPIPGDLVCYDWGFDGQYDHVGLFEEWVSGHAFSTIEGNTSETDNSNGGQVQNRFRDIVSQGTVFVRVAE